jgi:diacylglycerol kinase (ATP)
MDCVKRLWQAAINSWNGLVAVTQSEAAFRQELALLAVGIPLAFFLTTDVGKRFALIGVIVFILIVELLNTAVEKLCDRVTRDNDPAIKRVKDMGSAAIGLSLLAAGIVWLWILIERLWP